MLETCPLDSAFNEINEMQWWIKQLNFIIMHRRKHTEIVIKFYSAPHM